jgi:hypothetical protein
MSSGDPKSHKSKHKHRDRDEDGHKSSHKRKKKEGDREHRKKRRKDDEPAHSGVTLIDDDVDNDDYWVEKVVEGVADTVSSILAILSPPNSSLRYQPRNR